MTKITISEVTVGIVGGERPYVARAIDAQGAMVMEGHDAYMAETAWYNLDNRALQWRYGACNSMAEWSRAVAVTRFFNHDAPTLREYVRAWLRTR